MKHLTSALRLLLVASIAAAATGAQAAGEAADPKAFAVRIPVTAIPDAALQRLMLPAEALVRLQAPAYADLRVFNGQGQAVPMALAAAALPGRTEQEVRLPAFPVLGSASVGSLEGLSLRIEERQGRRVVQLNTGAPASSTAAASQKVLGALLDARAIRVPVARMALDVDLPAGQPVSFDVQSSKDLKSWRPLASTVLYRAEAAAGTAGNLGSSTIDLALADLADQYLRITWGDAAVTLRGATLATSLSGGAAPRVSATMAPPVPTSPHAVNFSLPFATPVAALKITPQGSNVLVPVRVLGRQDRNQPWTTLANTVVYRLAANGKDQLSAPVELRGASVREISIEADAKTPGFAAAPEITLQFEPVQIVFLASGTGPFTLAAGLPASAAVSAAYLPIASLIPGYKLGQENTLPAAQADVVRIEGVPVASGPMVVSSPGSGGLPTRSLVLWGVLLAGVLALGLMAWALLRQTRQVPPA